MAKRVRSYWRREKITAIHRLTTSSFVRIARVNLHRHRNLLWIIPACLQLMPFTALTDQGIFFVRDSKHSIYVLDFGSK